MKIAVIYLDGVALETHTLELWVDFASGWPHDGWLIKLLFAGSFWAKMVTRNLRNTWELFPQGDAKLDRL